MDYLKTLKELQEYYSNLLIIQYNGKPKAKATIELIANLIWSNMALLQIRDAFDWKTADSSDPNSTVGAQLDIIGKWVGVSRAYNQNNTWSNTYLSYPSYGTFTVAENDPQRGGYSDYYTFDYDADTPTTDAYIVEDEEEYSETWLSDTDGGTPLTPTIGTFYKVKTEGDFKNKVYCWNNNHYELYWAGGVLTYKDLQANTQLLGNEDCRTVIGLKIIKNNLEQNQGNIDRAVTLYFEEKINGEVVYKEVKDEEGNVIERYIENPLVYTTWETPHVVTYHYPQSLSTIINICLYKGVLLAPTGCSIQLAAY